MKTAFTRRTALKGAGVAAVAVSIGRLIGDLPAATGAATPEEMAGLRMHWGDLLTGRGSIVPGDADFAAAIGRIDAAIESSTAKLVSGPDRTRVFADLAFDDDAQMRTTWVRLEEMALGWATPGSSFHHDKRTLNTVLSGTADTHRLVYNDAQEEFGNWWSWEIGATRSLTNIMALLFDHLSAGEIASYCAAVDHFIPDPRYQFPDSRGKQLSTGANRVDICQATIVRGIVGQDPARLNEAVSALSPVWQYVTEDDGFYRDGSFIQHSTVPYTGTYGVVLLRGLARLFSLLGKSSYAVSDPSRTILYASVEDAFAPVVYDCQMMDSVRGRAVSRTDERSHDDAYLVIESILNLADAVDPSTAKRWQGMCAGWLRRDSFGNILDDATVPTVAAVKDLRASGVAPVAEPRGPRVFPSMDRAVFRGRSFAYALAMCSERITWYECGNGENNKGYHSGSGMTYLYDADNGHFDDEFWPTVDLNRLPGTTVDKTPLPEKVEGQWGSNTPAGGDWTGGAALDRYAAVGQHLIAPGDTGMRARKSWFFDGDRVVALGADIHGSSDAPVETIIENRNLHATGENILMADDGAVAPRLGDHVAVDDADWVHLDGVGGYLVLDESTLHALREERTGAWADINDNGPADSRTRRYVTLWLDHGVKPRAATYAYAVLPGATRRATAAEADDPSFAVQCNDAKAQAVRFMADRTVAINVWEATSVHGFRAEQPMTLIARRDRGRLHVAICDPTQQADSVTFVVERGGWRHASGDGVKATRSGNELSVTVDTADAAGRTQVITLTH